MSAADTALLALLATTNVDVNDTVVDSDNSGQVVTFPTPYFVYESSTGDDNQESTERLSGPGDKRSHFFSLAYIGDTPEQARAAGAKAHAAFRRTRITGTGIRSSGFITVDESQRVRRDDDAINPDGHALYRGVSLCSVVYTPEEFFS
jgi:hypothetical protein